MADERGRGRAAGPLAAAERTRDGAGSGLAAGGVGAALRLRARRVGAPVRSQRELGFATAGAGGGLAGSDPATSARRQDPGASGAEVSGAGGTPKSGGLPADGRHLRRAPLRYAPGRPTVCGVAQGAARNPQTDSGRSRAVFQNAAASAGESSGPRGHPDRRRIVTRSGNGGGDCEPSAAAAGRRRFHRVRSPAIESRTASDRAHSKPTPPHRRRNLRAKPPRAKLSPVTPAPTAPPKSVGASAL